MEHDGPLASGLAFAGVALTVLLLFRRGLATPFVIGSLIVGVLWLLALSMRLGIKINFVNFIAFPITFGIGVDYAVNVMGRYLRDGGRSVAAAVRGTGGAVALCSFTTIVGYSSLLVAKNVGLFLFGVLAVLGEVTCLVTAVVVLPSVLLLFRPQSSPRLPALRMGQGDRRDRRRGDAPAGARPDLRSRVVTGGPRRGRCGSVGAWKGDASAVSSAIERTVVRLTRRIATARSAGAPAARRSSRGSASSAPISRSWPARRRPFDRPFTERARSVHAAARR